MEDNAFNRLVGRSDHMDIALANFIIVTNTNISLPVRLIALRELLYMVEATNMIIAALSNVNNDYPEYLTGLDEFITPALAEISKHYNLISGLIDGNGPIDTSAFDGFIDKLLD